MGVQRGEFGPAFVAGLPRCGQPLAELLLVGAQGRELLLQPGQLGRGLGVGWRAGGAVIRRKPGDFGGGHCGLGFGAFRFLVRGDEVGGEFIDLVGGLGLRGGRGEMVGLQRLHPGFQGSRLGGGFLGGKLRLAQRLTGGGVAGIAGGLDGRGRLGKLRGEGVLLCAHRG